MEFWVILWKITLVVGLGAFAILAVGVTFFGARDIKHLLANLKENSEEKD